MNERVGLVLSALAFGFGVGCVAEDSGEAVAVSVQELRAGYGDESTSFVGMDLLVTDRDGRPVPCTEDGLEVTVRGTYVRADGSSSEVEADHVVLSCPESGAGDFALVLDNSGSEDPHLAELRRAASTFADRLVDGGGRASLVRVSTNSEVTAPLTGEGEALHEAIVGLSDTGGWTALYDGIRMGNETLGGAVERATEARRWDNASEFCASSRKLGIVTLTDGNENNSSGQELVSRRYPGDGLNTTLEDLHNLRVGGVTTPIYTVGIGTDVSQLGLTALSEATGGRHFAVEAPGDIERAFEVVSEYAGSTHQVCAQLPEGECGDLRLVVDYRVRNRGRGRDRRESLSGSREFRMFVECPQAVDARIATVLLTMSSPGIDSAVASTLASQTVGWVSPVARPHVLVVLDDSNHAEASDDAHYVKWLLEGQGVDATLRSEPDGGLRDRDVERYDVVWFSNPGYPPDDVQSIDTLRRFSAAGGGVVLQGDDMSWSWGRDFSMSPLTHLEHIDNGTSYCGHNVDNNAGGGYRVRLSADHPVLGALSGSTFLYGDDIDTTRPLSEGEQVLAWATIDGASGCPEKPVIVVFEP